MTNLYTRLPAPFRVDFTCVIGREMISYRNDGKGFTAITGKVENT